MWVKWEISTVFVESLLTLMLKTFRILVGVTHAKIGVRPKFIRASESRAGKNANWRSSGYNKPSERQLEDCPKALFDTWEGGNV